jgi:UDP-N-acetylglucosamine transferase subunit ALG13
LIFVTVGSQMPFDRLVQAMDDWAAYHPGQPVRAQIGRSTLRPAHIQADEVLTPEAFRQQVLAAEVIVAHAGMGSVLTAIEFRKPLVLMPRRGDLRETRNDHQVATAKWLAAKPGIQIVNSGEELAEALQTALGGGRQAPDAMASGPREALCTFLGGVLKDAAGR